MQKYYFVLIAALLLQSAAITSVAARGSNPGPVAPAKITPCARGVVYVMMRAGSGVLNSTAGKGDVILSAGGTAFEQVLTKLQMTSIVPFDAHAPNDAITHERGIDRMYCIYYSNYSIDAHAALDLLMATGEVECGSARYLFPVSKTTDDPLVGQQYGLTNMSVFSAWDITTGDTDIVVADVDVGFNITHEDLKNAIKINWAEFGAKGANGVDDDGDGLIDNWRGWDVVGSANVSAGEPLRPDNNPTPEDAGGNHGSLTAGCIAASGDNALGVVGVAYGCRFLPIKAGGADYASNVGGGYEGVHYASTHGARIINCSWGGPVGGSDVSFANVFLQEATDRNALIVAASGNDAADDDLVPTYPGNGPGVLCVGATNSDDGPANYSNYGHTVQVWAPGTNIESTNWPGNSSYAAESGTSFACPNTAGVAALVATLHPNWPPGFIARQIIQTCDNVVSPFDQFNYWGRVNARSALSAPTGPGLTIVSYSIAGVPADSLGNPGQQVNLRVMFKNVISSGTNLQARLLPGTGYLTTGITAPLGNVAAEGTVFADYQITRTGVFSEGRMPVRFYMTDGGNYHDTISLMLPLRKIPGFMVEKTLLLGQSVKRVSHTDAWAAFGVMPASTSSANPIALFARQTGSVWSDTIPLGDGLATAYDVEATDPLTAWFGTGKDNVASVISTNDGGKNFNSVDVSDITPFVNSIHFFDASNGIFIGDPISQIWGIAVTSDAGQSWNPIPTNAASLGSTEASWNNATAWVGSHGWFGSNSSRIWYTNDAGQTWKSAKTAFTNSLALSFDDDALHGIACFRPATSSSGGSSGKKGMQLTTNGGQTWTTLKLPAPGSIPGEVKFVPGTHTAIITSDSGVYRTTDFGTSWSPIGIPSSFAVLSGDLSVYRTDNRLTVTFLNSLGTIASYSESVGDTQPSHGITVSQSSVDFGTIEIGSSDTVVLTMTNFNATPLTVSGLSVNPASTRFSYFGTSFPKTLQPSDKVNVSLVFHPDAEGRQDGNLAVTLSDASVSQVTMTGVGKAAAGDAVSESVNSGFELSVLENPTHGRTQIQFSLARTETAHLSVFDALGREIAILANGLQAAGGHAVAFNGAVLPTGVYYCVLLTESGHRLTRAFTLLP